MIRTAFPMAQELYQETNPGSAGNPGIGPTFDELLDVSLRFLDERVVPLVFAHITMNWRGRPLVSHEVIVNLIGATTTKLAPLHSYRYLRKALSGADPEDE